MEVLPIQTARMNATYRDQALFGMSTAGAKTLALLLLPGISGAGKLNLQALLWHKHLTNLPVTGLA